MGFQPNTETYTSLMDGFVRNGRMEQTEEMMNEIKIMGVRLSCATSYWLIKGYIKQDMVDQAIQHYEKMKENGEKIEFRLYEILVEGFMKQKPEKAHELLQNMKRDGLVPSLNIYNAMILAYAKKSMMDQAMQVYQEMQVNGVPANADTYNRLIRGYLKKSELGPALELMGKMKYEGVKPDQETSDVLLGAILNESIKKNDYANSMIFALREAGVNSKAIQQTNVIATNLGNGRLEVALMEYDRMVQGNLKLSGSVLEMLIEEVLKDIKTRTEAKMNRRALSQSEKSLNKFKIPGLELDLDLDLDLSLQLKLNMDQDAPEQLLVT